MKTEAAISEAVKEASMSDGTMISFSERSAPPKSIDDIMLNEWFLADVKIGKNIMTCVCFFAVSPASEPDVVAFPAGGIIPKYLRDRKECCSDGKEYCSGLVLTDSEKQSLVIIDIIGEMNISLIRKGL